MAHHHSHAGSIGSTEEPSHSSQHSTSAEEDVDVIVDEVIECQPEPRDQCRVDRDGGDSSSPLSQHTSTSSSHSTMSPPQEVAGIGRSDPLTKIAKLPHSQCQCCHLLKHVAEVSQVKCSYLEMYSLGLQVGDMLMLLLFLLYHSRFRPKSCHLEPNYH